MPETHSELTNNNHELTFTAHSLRIAVSTEENRRLTSGNHTLKFKPGTLVVTDV